MAITTQEHAHFVSLLNAIDPFKFTTLHAVWQFLANSESMLLQVLQGRSVATETDEGHPEFGMLLHYLHHPHADFLSFTADDAVATSAFNLLASANKPASNISLDDYQQLVNAASSQATPIIGDDGTIYDFSPYGQLNPKWAFTLLNMVIAWVVGKHPFGNQPYTVSLKPNAQGTVKLGLIGDWGTGNYAPANGPAMPILTQLQACNPDYLFHLGDVYYAGTGDFPFVPAHEESNNFINLWPNTAANSSFTLNSNHEMYPGDHGYYGSALTSPHFRHQNNTSYFALTFGQWVILGLDSAYYADPSTFYMFGALGQAQIAWIQSLATKIGGYADKRVLVMTHHNGFAYNGQGSSNTLWADVNTALGRPADVWYWGHIHNNIAYSVLSPAGNTTLARCLGGSAIPFGVASGLLDANGNMLNTVEYFSRTAGPYASYQVLNGYATLELSADGGLTESIYEQNNPAAVWTKTSGLST